jgi:N-dimethylarginine dimethylaminohydrolase
MTADHIYQMTVKLFGPEAEPAFETSGELTANFGRDWGCDNDVGQLRAVLMHRPGREFDVIDPSKRIESIGSFGDLEEGWYFQSDTIPSLAEMQAQHDGLVRALRDDGVEVVLLEGDVGNRFKACYTRDSSFAVRGGAVVTRLAVRMRRGEELLATRTLAALGMPILRTIHGSGLVEGGSFAWIDSRHAALGRSIRVNDAGIAQVAEVLAHQGVELIVVDMPGYSIHLDGAFLMVDADLALVDATQLPYAFLQRLKELKIRTIEITPEDDGWIINGLAVRPGRLIVPPGVSDRTREALEKSKVQLVELAYDNMHHNGGGIHCSTCPLIRDSLD